MPLMGEGLLVAWTDVLPEAEQAFNRWYTLEHVPERIGIPGFLRGRRYVAGQRERHRYFTLYETRTIDVLRSPAYVARLNEPSPGTRAMMPSFRNMMRG